MPQIERPDGVAIHWEERGEGPAVVAAMGWAGHPTALADVLAELARDHRVITFDPRGTGSSTRAGPYDVKTDTGDLEALLEHVGGGVLWVVADAVTRGIRLAAKRPDLARALVCYNGPPLHPSALSGSEALMSSDAVASGLREMLTRDYRAAVRSVIRLANEQMSEDEVRERVTAQLAYYPQAAAVPRALAWAADDPLEYARVAGQRVWVIVTREGAGPWFPGGPETSRVLRESLPDAHISEIEDGPLSRPDLSAELLRRAVREGG